MGIVTLIEEGYKEKSTLPAKSWRDTDSVCIIRAVHVCTAYRETRRLSEPERQRRAFRSFVPFAGAQARTKALATQFQLGLVANSGQAALNALRRDGLQELFTVIALADFVGVEKPDERIFRYALETAGVSSSRAVHVGNRLESDIRPAQKLGIRTVWLLRGDAPPAPTLDQLAEPDAVIISLVGLPTALSRLTGSTELSHSLDSVESLKS